MDVGKVKGDEMIIFMMNATWKMYITMGGHCTIYVCMYNVNRECPKKGF